MSIARQQFKEATRRIGRTHFAESSDIANATICGRKFLLPRIYGATGRGNERYISGTLAHRVLDLIGVTLILLWEQKASKDRIVESWKPAIDKVFGQFRSQAKYKGIPPEKYLNAAQDRLERIAFVLSEYFKTEICPKTIRTEITISNPTTRHEGRIDAIFEYEDGSSETVDWKTNDSGSVTQYERLQTVANGMLVNYRHSRQEDDFANNELTIFTPEGVHHPIPTQKAMDDIRKARKYILDWLEDKQPHTELPSPYVCYECSYYDPCRFYMYDKTPENIHKLLWYRRFRVLRKRERSHLNKFLTAELNPSELAELGILAQGYEVKSIGQDTITLVKPDPSRNLFPGDSVRVIGLEPGIPVLACVSVNGSVSGVEGNVVKVKVFRGKMADLDGLQAGILRSDVDLSRRELESIDRVHRRPGPYQDLALALIGEVEE